MRMLAVVPCFALLFTAAANAQSVSVSTPSAASAPTLVPALVPYTGVATAADGKPLTGEASAIFSLFKDERGGGPFWTESQTVTIDASGHYEVKLGASSANGLPLDTFASGQVRWLEVQIAGQPTGPRMLLTSVPYALKAADSATLGGLPASAFVLASALPVGTAMSGNAVTPDAASNVTTTGGTNFYVPRFNAATTIVNSEIYDTGTSVGIGGIPNSSVKLDVNGAMIMRGNMQVTRTGNATTSKAYPSYGFQFYSNAYNSSSKAGDNPYFQLQSEPTGNNSASPSATFNLLFSNNGAAAAETGLFINPNGTLHFSSAQTFPATSSSGTAVDGTSTSGTGVQGNSTSSNGVAGTSSGGDGVLGVTAGTTLHTAGILGIAGTGNTSGFSGIAGVWGDANAHVGVFGSSTQYDGVFGQSDSGSGLEGASNSGYGLIAGTNDTSGEGYAGVRGYSNASSPGVNGQSANGSGVLGVASGNSQTYGSYAQNPVGAWGDTSMYYGYGVFGTADQGGAGYFANNSQSNSTVTMINSAAPYTDPSYVQPTMLNAVGNNGRFCYIDITGELVCNSTGNASSIQNGERTVKTFAVQSAESWYEDAGSGELVNGSGHVDLEPTFGQTVNTGIEYHVFLTPDGDCKGLYVAHKSANGFDVRELGGGKASVPFEYRIMAKRMGHENERLVDLTEQSRKLAAMARPKVAAKVGSAHATIRPVSPLSKPLPQ